MTNDLHFVFYANASPAIGAGHVMRLYALAQASLKRGIKVSFLSCECPQNLQQKLKTLGVNLIMLAHKLDIVDIQVLTPSALIIDDYTLSDSQWNMLSRLDCWVTYLDDQVSNNAIFANMVVNAAPSAKIKDYKQRAGDATLCLGPKFTLLREEFSQSNEQGVIDLSGVQQLLITLGGSDVKQMSYALAKAILTDLLPKFPKLSICVLLGGLNSTLLPQLKMLKNQYAALRVIEQSDNVAQLMRQSGLAISAAGGTLNELAAIGTPTLALVSVDNQKAALLSPYAGDSFEVMDVRTYNPSVQSHINETNRMIIDNIVGITEKLWRDLCKRQHMSSRSRQIIDGLGCERVIDTIIERVND